jgi:hypothetical protein
MLTRENFKDTWARPKPDDTQRSPWQEKMALDPPLKSSKSTNGGMEAVMREDNSGDRKVEDVVVEKRIKVPCRMPVFKFQRHGIGDKRKWHSPSGRVHG